MSHLFIASQVKRKPASLIGAFISAEECQQLKQAFAEKYPDQVPSLFISKELLLKSIAGVSNISGIRFTYGLNDSNDASSRRIILVPSCNKSNGESGMIPVMSPNGYLCDNGERINFDKLLTLLGNHVINFKNVSSEIPLLKIPRGYFWGINKIEKLLEVENCAGLVFHFGFNPGLQTASRQFQSVLEVVDVSHKSLHVYLEYGHPPGGGDETTCVASLAAEKFTNDAEPRLDVLRGFRDNWLIQQENGQALYEMYYFLSSAIVEEIQDRPDQEAIWQDIYYDGFAKCLDFINQKKNEEAKAFYITMMNNLVLQFLSQ